MTDTLKTLWKAKDPKALPDFIIGGAMKSGTTTLHAILNSHPDVSIAHDELGFFDIDSITQHPDFNFFNANDSTWSSQSMLEHPEKLWNWYYSQFKNIRSSATIVGEDSTTYLTSEIAAKRIALQEKPIKVIFILRHPTKRTISNYLHLLKSGRAIYSLEDTIRYNPDSIIKRSLYKQQLESYYKHLPFERIKLVLFEDLLTKKKDCIKELCSFLEIDFDKFDKDVFQTHSNKTKIPKYLKLQLLRNRLLKHIGNYRYSNFLPIQPSFHKSMPIRYKLIHKVHKKINPHSSNNTFNVKPATIEMLDAFFRTELEGLDTIIKKDVYSKWF